MKRHWTAKETDMLINLVDQGVSYARIAKRLKRSEGSIRMRCKKIGVRITTTRATMSAHAVAAQLGLSCSKIVARWIRLGWLKASDAGTGRRLWRISWEQLTAFLENPDHWIAWSPAGIPDAALREWAIEIRGEHGRLCSQTEVARRFHVQPKTVATWIDRGHLPAVRYGNRQIPERALGGFVPPCDRPRRAANAAEAVRP